MKYSTIALIYFIGAIILAWTDQFVMVPVWISLGCIYTTFDDEDVRRVNRKEDSP